MLDAIQGEPFSLCGKKWQYRGEGNANLVLALPEERKIVRLRKSGEGEEAEKGEKAAQERIWREAWFCKGVMAPMLGECYIQTPTVAYIDRSELRRIERVLSSQRPVIRHHKGLHLRHVMVYPDYTLLPAFLASSGRAPPTFCVEVKPKQGWLPPADRHLPKCTFCINQFLKLKNGTIRCRSHYCPLDLFSGNIVRMKKALRCLLANPQNNLKIFKDGVLVYGDDKIGNLRCVLEHWFPNDVLSFHRLEDKLCSLIVDALLRDLAAPLELRTLQWHQEIEEEVSPIIERIPGSLINSVASLLKEIPCDWASEPVPQGCILSTILSMQRLEQSGSDYIYHKFQSLPHSPSNDFSYVNSLLSSNVMNSIDRYLLATTAKDCSIMISFQRLMHPVNCQVPPQYLVQDLDSILYKFNVGVSDLDPKPLSCIEKHRQRDYDTLRACMEMFQCSSKPISNNVPEQTFIVR